MLAHALSLWDSHPDHILAVLGVLNLFLITYVLRRIPKVLKKSASVAHIRQLAKLGDTHLFELKSFMEGSSDSLALYAFREIVKLNSNAVNAGMLQKVLFRASKKKTLLTSCLYRISKGGNGRLIAETLNPDLPDWIYILCLKILCKDRNTDIVAVLVRAKDHPSTTIQEAANHMLENLDLTKIA